MSDTVSARREELLIRRQLLLARSAALRLDIAVHSRAVQIPMAWGDQVLAAFDWMRRNPVWPAAGAGLVLLVRPRRAFRVVGRGIAVWQLWRRARPMLAPLVRAWRQAGPRR